MSADPGARLRCKRCEHEKAPLAFTKSGIERRICRECRATEFKARHARNPQHVRALSRASNQRNRPNWSEREKAYYRQKKAAGPWIKNADPQKRWARGVVQDALRSGDLIKPTSCDGCGIIGKRLDAHHDDYKKPLHILWLCRACHGERHRKAS